MRKFLCNLFKLVPVEQYVGDLKCQAEQAEISNAMAYDRGVKQAKVHWRIMPMPFTAEQLAGGEYGDFITPAGFATVLGECSVPAPSKNGYEQRAYYVNKYALDSGSSDLQCYGPAKFSQPNSSDALVPVIVTVLR